MAGATKRKVLASSGPGHKIQQVLGKYKLPGNGKSTFKKNQKLSTPLKKVPEMDTSSWSTLSVLNICVGLVAVVMVSYAHALYMYQLHENQLWFSNIKEVEREISFRTECGLYYSYFKQLVNSPSLLQGIQDLMQDTATEHPDTINILERMNVYQELFLAFLYKRLGLTMQPIFFYSYFIFGLHGLLVFGLSLTTWLLSNSWLASLLTATFYMLNRLDTTRVETSLALRENFALPFLWLQAAALTLYFKPQISGKLQGISLFAVFFNTLVFCLTWQFNQFIMLLQGFSLFGLWVLGLGSSLKVKKVLLCQLVSLLVVSCLQFGNTMILSSLALSFAGSALVIIYCLGDQNTPRSFIRGSAWVVGLSLLVLTLMVAISTGIKVLLDGDSDEHIFKFLQNKFGVGEVRDFDARMYLCLNIFGFITWDIFERLTRNMVLPLYVPIHIGLLCLLGYTVFNRWTRTDLLSKTVDTPGNNEPGKSENTHAGLTRRPDLAFHTVQAVFFGALAISTMRMKYLWTPYICVLAAVGVADLALWSRLLSVVKVRSDWTIEVVRSAVVVALLAITLTFLIVNVRKELENELEFFDPDTVELMNWIIRNTPAAASFTGSMQLLAGVKLCTGRHITNHPHYEDKYLRKKTKELYQIYGRRKPKDVYQILKKYNTDFIILEDSICLAQSNGCRTPDIVDIDNGMMPDVPVEIDGLNKSSTPRFCDQVRHQPGSYSRFFLALFENKTFRIYRVL